MDRVTDEELAEVGHLADKGAGGLLVRFAAEVRALRTRVTEMHATIATTSRNAASLIAEHERIEAALRAQVEALTAERDALRARARAVCEDAENSEEPTIALVGTDVLDALEDALRLKGEEP